MATIFAGSAPAKDRHKQERIERAVELGLKGAAIGSDIFSRAEEILQSRRREKIANLTAASGMVGGFHKLPQATKNEIPKLYGFDLPRDADGNVVIDPTNEQKLQELGMQDLLNDPEKAVNAARIFMGLQDKAPSPERMQLELDKVNANIAGDKQIQFLKDQRAALDRQQRDLASQRTLAGRLGAARISASRPREGDLPSVFAFSGDMSDPFVPAGTPGARPLTNRQFDAINKKLDTDSKLVDRKIRQQKLRADADIARAKLERQPMEVASRFLTDYKKVSEMKGKRADKTLAQRTFIAQWGKYMLQELEVSPEGLGNFWGSSEMARNLEEMQLQLDSAREAPGFSTSTAPTSSTVGSAIRTTTTTIPSIQEQNSYLNTKQSGIRYRQ